MARDDIIEECAREIDRLLRKDEATAQLGSVSAGQAMTAYRRALREAAEAVRALKERH